MASLEALASAAGEAVQEAWEEGGQYKHVLSIGGETCRLQSRYYAYARQAVAVSLSPSVCFYLSLPVSAWMSGVSA